MLSERESLSSYYLLAIKTRISSLKRATVVLVDVEVHVFLFCLAQFVNSLICKLQLQLTSYP